MLRIFAAALLIAAMIVPISAQAQQQTRVALVIGNGAYTGPHLSPLANPRNDAQDMAAALRALNFTVRAHNDLSADAMVAALEDFKLQALRADIALVYYAGHGMRDGDETFLLAADAAPTRASQLPRHALTLSEILETLQATTGLKVVILDSCRDVGLAPFLQRQEIAASRSWNRSSAQTRAAEIGRGVTRPQAAPDTLIAFATAPTEIASDGPGQRNSPFTAALLRHLTDREEIGFIFRRVRQVVVNATRGRQRPEVLNAIGARKYFLAGPPTVERPGGQPQTGGSCAYVDTPAGFECYVEGGRARFRRVAPAPVRPVQPTRSAPAPARNPCAGLSSPGWECVPENGQATWRREQGQTSEPARPEAAPMGWRVGEGAAQAVRSTAAEDAQRRFACRASTGAQGVSFGRKCWPLDTTKIEYGDIPLSVRRKITDASPLAGLTELQELSLYNTQVSDLTPLSGLRGLQRLWLHNTRVSDLTPLAGMTALQTLSLSWTQVSDLTPLSGMTALRSLYLSFTQVSDLTPLSGMTALQTLYLSRTQVSDLTPLQGMTALQTLYLSRTQVSDLTPLQGMTALHYLEMRDKVGVGGRNSDTPANRAAVARAIREWRPTRR